jgi:hypothetical protein
MLLAANALCGAVAPLSALRNPAIDLVQDRVVDIAAERALDRL